MAILHHRLYVWIPALVGGVLVLALAIGGMFIHTLEDELLTEAGERLAVGAIDVAEKLDRVLFERYGDIQLLARAAVLQGRDQAAMTAYLNEVRDVYFYYQWIGVADASGRIVAATDPGTIGRDVSATAWFQAVRTGSTIDVLDVRRLPEVGGAPAVAFTIPLTDADGRFRGAISSRVMLTVLEDVIEQTMVSLLSQHGTQARVEYQLIRMDGELLADSLLREEGRVNLAHLGVRSAQLAASAPSGFLDERHERRRVPVLTGYAKTKGFEAFPGFGWTVLVRMDKEDLLAPITAVLWRLGLIGGLGLFPLLGLFFWTAGRLSIEWRTAVRDRDRAVAAEAALSERTLVLDALVETGRRITAEIDMERLLQAIVEAAQRLTGARYAALGVFDKTGTALAHLITLGIDEAGRQAIGVLPTGRGLLGHLADEPDVLRLKDLTQHPASSGFPPHHPPMRAFLGVSIRSRGRLFGRLYLTDEASEFTELDEQVIMALAAQAGIAIENSAVLQDLRDAGEELKRVNVSLRAATQELEDMTSIIAHDLKAPLVTIQGYAGRLEATCWEHLDEKSRRQISTIREVSKIMGQMVEGLLEVSRIHRRAFRPQRCDIAAAVERVCASLNEPIAATGAPITLELAPTASQTWVDPVAFYEIVQNLLSNALKFGAPGRPLAIQIGSHAQESHVLLWVRDNGVGIPADKREEVFQIFRKLNRNTPGVGVGLAGVKQLVGQSGGKVWIEPAPGHGTSVLFTLPRV